MNLDEIEQSGRYKMGTLYNINRQLLDLDKTLDCGETFRWIKIGAQWFGIVAGQLIQLEQDDMTGTIKTNLQQELTDTWLVNYLDLNTDYSPLEQVMQTNDEFAKQSLIAGHGIRILKQDFWETAISFIIQQQNNIPKIKTQIAKLCRIGKQVQVPGSLWGIDIQTEQTLRNQHAFPTVEEIINNREYIISQCQLGYRADYILTIADSLVTQTAADKYGLILKAKGPDSQMKVLMGHKGIGPKVASCIMLFQLHYLQSFPVDVWVKRIADTYYNGNIPVSNYGSLAGLMQQYMFYNIRQLNKA